MERFKECIKKYKIYIICILIILSSIVSIILQQIEKKQALQVNQVPIETQKGKIAIYITGAVQNPGVYYLEENSRLTQALDACGGIRENADVNALNLAQKLVDGDKVVVSEKKEKTEEGSWEEDSSTSDSKKININTASESQLEEITGVGPSTAKKIIEYRKNNAFNSIEDIMEVPGIGESKFDAMKDSICVD